MHSKSAEQLARSPVRRDVEAHQHHGDWSLWVLFWGAGIVLTGHIVLGQPVGYLVFAVVLVFVFAMVNGISVGISDSNPISSAFVVCVVLMAAIGLRGPAVGLMAGTVLLVSTSVASTCSRTGRPAGGWAPIASFSSATRL